jgi:predicted  nucleic acid-binding Zn ribbon protein
MNHHSDDSYLKLRPPPTTPANELCHCPGHPAIKLMCALSYNPLHCLDCNLEIEATSLSLPPQLVEPIAAWRSSYDAIYRLWLESANYEDWARAQLSDIASPINVGGMRLREQLDQVRRCYLWYFQDQSADSFTPMMHCPKCGNAFSAYHSGIFAQYLCERCGIVTVGT